jgi:signal transduction histidine kinase
MATARAVPRSVRVFRALFVLAGWAIAAWGITAFEPGRTATYVGYAVLMIAVRFFRIEGSFDFPLPYLATAIAFTYIIGFPSITLDYAIGAPILLAQLALAERGWVRSSPALQLVHAARGNRRESVRALIDIMAAYTIVTIGLAFRVIVFHTLREHFAASNAMALIAITELLAMAFVGVLTFSLPLPPGEVFKAQAPWRFALEDERADITYASTLLLPLLVFLICYGFEVHGIAGAFAWSACTLGPHYLLKLLKDRRTSLVQRHQALRDLNADLKRQQEDQKAFVYTVTHDLKSPVSAILLTADAALERDGEEMPAGTRDDLDRIALLAAGTEDMIRDLMGLFEIVSAREPFQPVNLSDAVTRALDVLRPQLAAKRVHVEVDALPTILGQPSKLGHVLANLLGNAVKYVPSGSGRIAVTADQCDGETLLCVRDNGIGIARDYHRTIFELFVRVPAHEQTVDGAAVPGTGVGLAIVKQVVEAHRGAVWVESAPGTGSSFFVRLPDLYPTRQ